MVYVECGVFVWVGSVLSWVVGVVFVVVVGEIIGIGSYEFRLVRLVFRW